MIRRAAGGLDLVGVVLSVSGWVTLLLTHSAAGGVRVAAVFAFTYFGPGLGVVRLIGFADPLERFVLAIAISASIGIVVTEMLAIPHLLTASSGITALAVITTGLAVARAVRPGKRSTTEAMEAPTC